ncbi:MAG: ABC-type antimicrobial peptide transport system, ATPase component [Parcubacteria group bacterium GW2011_GWE2_38_18]|nr:MAG: ABC-type antimicrobial peptide transport system, ATPase component [Parcubacteria group bacterium GW2011_GWE2_38_18]
MHPIIKVEHLDVIYFLGKSNEVRALSDINIEIYPEEFIIFFGPSGCGKSTLLYSIAGLETNIHGNIFIEDKNLALFDKKETLQLHRKTIGMIFQAFHLIPTLTVQKNVVLPQILTNVNKKERTKKALELLEYFGVKAQAHKLPAELSGGQQQRVAIARSLINDPSILMADEPIGNLDSKSAQDVMDLLKNLNEKQKKTIILVTHNPAFLSYAHRVFYIKDGKIVETRVNSNVHGVTVPQAESAKHTISRDIELLINTFSSLSPNQIGNLLIPFKAKQIVSEALIGMTTEEVEKIEKKVENLLLTGIYDNESTFEFLDQGPDKGGVDMDKRTARKIADKIKDIVGEIKTLEAEENKIKMRISPDSGGEVMQVRHYLLDEFDIEIKNFITLEVINQAIKDRLTNVIDRDVFRKRLGLPVSRGGAGINKRTAKKMAKRLELLILGKYK